jgi:hypothetical protein
MSIGLRIAVTSDQIIARAESVVEIVTFIVINGPRSSKRLSYESKEIEHR